jgi:nucleoside-diphosphate-sugar epimerase
MRVLVLGGTRFTGPFVVRELVEGGHEVTVFHRGEVEHDLTSGARHVHGDLEDFDRFLPELRALEPNVVVDLRAFRREEGRRASAFKGVASHAVVASSADVYRAFGRIHRTEPGEPDPLPLTEGSPLREVVIDETYDKVGVERAARSDPEFPVTILRLPAIHGPGDYLHRLYAYVKRMDDRRPAILLDEEIAGWRWVRGYVENVAHAVCVAALEERTAGRTYNVADPIAFTELEWVQQIADAHGWAGQIVVLPNQEMPPGLRQSNSFDLRQDYVVDSTEIRRDLQYAELVAAEEALHRTIEWERDHPPESLSPAEWDYEAEDEAYSTIRSSGGLSQFQ